MSPVAAVVALGVVSPVGVSPVRVSPVAATAEATAEATSEAAAVAGGMSPVTATAVPAEVTRLSRSSYGQAPAA